MSGHSNQVIQDTHLDVTGALSDAGETRNWFGHAARVLQYVDDWGDLALVVVDGEDLVAGQVQCREED